MGKWAGENEPVTILLSQILENSLLSSKECKEVSYTTFVFWTLMDACYEKCSRSGTSVSIFVSQSE